MTSSASIQSSPALQRYPRVQRVRLRPRTRSWRKRMLADHPVGVVFICVIIALVLMLSIFRHELMLSEPIAGVRTNKGDAFSENRRGEVLFTSPQGDCRKFVFDNRSGLFSNEGQRCNDSRFDLPGGGPASAPNQRLNAFQKVFAR